MPTSRKLKLRAVLWLMLSAAGLLGCETPTAVIDRGCDWTRQMVPPTYSGGDTPPTQAEVKRAAIDIRAHNAARGAVCKAPAPPRPV